MYNTHKKKCINIRYFSIPITHFAKIKAFIAGAFHIFAGKQSTPTTPGTKIAEGGGLRRQRGMG